VDPVTIEQFAMGVPAAARHLGIDRKTIDHAIAAQLLPARRVGPKGGRWSIEVEDLIAWYRSLGREVRDDTPA
jgi:hypothetical protein